MKKLLHIFSILTFTISLGYAQSSNSFQIDGEILPERRICSIHITPLNFHYIYSQELDKLGDGSQRVQGIIELHKCDLSLIPGEGSSPQFTLTIESGDPSPNDQYWSTLNKANADHLGIYLEIFGQRVPPSGKEINIPMDKNMTNYQIPIMAQIKKIAEGEVVSDEINVPIFYKMSFK